MRLFDPATDHIPTETPPTSPQRSVRPRREPAISSAQVPGTPHPPLAPKSLIEGAVCVGWTWLNQQERDRTPHMGAQDRFIDELKPSVESQKTKIQNLSKRLTGTDGKVEGHESLIRILQREPGPQAATDLVCHSTQSDSSGT
ncbi:hypothetical protein BFJ63_vAg11178 [Fusarium oxysporum f. sp. narcissi]|uniref:Uncharacterized protein n=2 Tax=Fusarium oxysporum TaxID=5507 RepID=A0A2H3GXR1_FUSOX|nr:hypothetical protein AU210_010154 [Fusarium oxysporum f. sp. radicis-cucumerinum]RYC85998.1 hypothetical protein BFJ63_vAg11178 [Fusarium oxysporum f. sp. narcissi]